jgi:hypothetical protein
LLKLLEEPPVSTQLFVHVDDPENVLPTILSRCRRLDVQSLPKDFQWETLTVNVSLEKTILTIPNILNPSAMSLQSIFAQAEKLGSADRTDLIQYIDELLSVLSRQPFTYKIHHGSQHMQSLMEAKKLLQKNVTVRLVIEDLLLSLFYRPFAET